MRRERVAASRSSQVRQLKQPVGGVTLQEITPDSVVEHLRADGVIPPHAQATVETLGGGVSNIVLKVSAGGTALVVKQALPKLRVREEWLADVDRIFRETEAMEALAPLLHPGEVPGVVYKSQAHYFFAMTCAPPTAAPWKEALMRGEARPNVAAAVGDLLGRMHRHTYRNLQLADRFGDQTVFHQLRLDPYYETVAMRHPDVANAVEAARAAMQSHREALVHGDYSPKNILVEPAAGWGTYVRLVLLDFEVAHYGDPTFDAAFCLNHLILKACRFASERSRYLAAARRFWQAYVTVLPGELARTAEGRAVTQLGVLLLARIDGKSPAEYITDPGLNEVVRGIAKAIMLRGYVGLEAVYSLVDMRLAEWLRQGAKPPTGDL